ncbi:hypothetical protein ACHHV8_00295 [Paenibacillus sp. TAB 01]|uniref:hypothetical protein n=1 Tax=Paenibacillus sp. TAB 01 TaxID=3368988 RepID=UPI003752C774
MNEKIFTVKKYIKACFIIFSVILICMSLYHKPNRYGDGWEYFGMTLSFVNHLSPDLRQEDIEMRHKVAIQDNIDANIIKEIDYSGYFEDLKGDYYSYHFWFYSLICVPFYLMLKVFHFDTFKVFQVINSLMYILMIWWIIYRNSFCVKKKIWLVIVSFFNPILFYIPWSHTEVFSYVFLFIGLLEFLERRLIVSVLLISIASLQNPAIAVISACIVLFHLYESKKLDKRFIILSLCSCIVLIPYLFYYIKFNQFNIIASTGIASVKLISISKILSLFFDLNFGMIVYIPVIVVCLLCALFTRKRSAVLWGIILIMMSVVCATQANWNSGMMYINRYTVWMIPVVIIATLDFIVKLKTKNIIILTVLFIFTSGPVISYCIIKYDGSNYIKFSPLARYVMSATPSLYQPPYEVFVERALGKEVPWNEVLPPVALWSWSGERKAYIQDSYGIQGYLNGNYKATLSKDIFNLSSFNPKEDIFSEPQKAAFLSGWYGLETNSVSNYRWMDEVSELIFNSNTDKISEFNLNIGSFYQERNCEIYVNDLKVFVGKIKLEPHRIDFSAHVKPGLNKIRIVSLSQSTTPNKIKELHNGDSRALSFSISSLSINN